MINKYTTPAQMCIHCHGYLQHLGTQSFCPSCLKFASNLTQQLRVVPEQYQSNCKNKMQLEKDRRYNTLLKQFTDKYWQIRSKEELELYRERLSMIKRRSVGKKGSRQAAGVVVYFHMQEQIKLTMKEYCVNNNLNLKLFHQKYKIYLKAIQQSTNNPSLPVLPLPKEEEEELNKLEESPTEKQSRQYFYSSEESALPEYKGQEGKSFQERAKHAILTIYDYIFQKFLFKEKKNMIVSGLMDKFELIDGRTLKAIGYYQNQPLKTYYLVFAVIKTLGYGITFLEFADIVLKQTSFILKRKTAGEIKKIYQAHAVTSLKSRKEVEEKGDEDEEDAFKVKVEEEVVDESPKKEESGKKRVVRRRVKEEKARVELSDSELLLDGKTDYF